MTTTARDLDALDCCLDTLSALRYGRMPAESAAEVSEQNRRALTRIRATLAHLDESRRLLKIAYALDNDAQSHEIDCRAYSTDMAAWLEADAARRKP